MNIKKLEVCPFEEWITIEIDGKEKTFDLMNTNDINIKVFYLDNEYKNPVHFNSKTRNIEN